MQEVLEQLQERHQASLTSLDLPTEDQIILAEEEILMPLPYEYRQFLIEASHLMLGTLEPATVADPRSHTFLPEITALAWDCGLPREYVPVCQSGQGYYCIDQMGAILFWTTEGVSEDTWESIWHWARDIWLNS